MAITIVILGKNIMNRDTESQLVAVNNFNYEYLIICI